jgi:putative sterol carrier protein
MELFTPDWQAAWKDRLDQSEDYRTAAAKWEGALILDVHAEGQSPAARLFLDLHHGECRSVRDAVSEDECRFELSAPRAVWLDLLEKGSDPIYMVMRGKLKLLQGSKSQLLPYAKAAKAMLAAARGIEG